MEFPTPQALEEKWSPVLQHADLPEIKDAHRRQVTAVLLENQQKSLAEEKQTLMEAGSVAANAANYDPVLIGLVRRAMPQLIAYDICGVQPMTMPSGLVFALTSRYTNAAGAEALFNEAGAGASSKTSGEYTTNAGDKPQVGDSPVADGAGEGQGLSPWDANGGFTAYGGMATSVAEAVNPAEMSFKIEKSTVTAQSRALKAEYTVELQQDLKSVHGLDAEGELSNILSNEIIAEINREIIRKIYVTSKVGAQNTTSAGTYDLDVDANGRWSVERFKGLLFQIEREANRIAQTTRRGRGNFILCSSDVASALAMAGVLDYAPALSTDLNVDEASTTFAGVLNKKYKVYVDPYLANGSTAQFATVGYKGTSAFDAGMFYCPYVPLSLMRAVDPTTFQPKIGFKTRYGLIQHPLAADPTGFGANTNNFYRSFRINNLS